MLLPLAQECMCFSPSPRSVCVTPPHPGVYVLLHLAQECMCYSPSPRSVCVTPPHPGVYVLLPLSQECMCNSFDSLQLRTMSRSSSLRSKSSVSSKGSGFSRILTLRRHHDSDTDSFGDEEASAANPKKKNRHRIQIPLFTEDVERDKRKLLESLSEVTGILSIYCGSDKSNVS